jgi:WD40 repeat protein
LIETTTAHSSAVWSLHIRADGRAMVSGSADKNVKFWEFGHKNATDENASSTIATPLDFLSDAFSWMKATKRNFVNAGTCSDTEDA